MSLFQKIRARVVQALDDMASQGQLPEGLNLTAVTVEPPRDPAHGDMATNAAMVLAKGAGQKPRDIAMTLAEHLLKDELIDAADVAGPGFLNLRLNRSVWQSVVAQVLDEKAEFGRSTIGKGKKINVEFVSANPTGPLHVGHVRGAVFGDALSNLLDLAGFDVTKEYYINDGGAQVDVLARSVYLRYLEAHGRTIAFEDGTYPGDYLIPVGEALKEKVGDAWLDQPEDVWLADAREFATDAMMEMIRVDLKDLGVEMDQYYSEKSLYGTGRIEAALEDLKSKGLIYEGTLEPPKGKLPEDWEARIQMLFKSTEHGDDVDRPVQKSDGNWTYFAPDIAYHFDKISRGFDALIDVFGADHGGYVKRMKAAVSALSDGNVSLDIKLIQLVKLMKNGAEFKMSKRAGTFVTLRDVLDMVGADVTRFVMLTRKNDAPLEFDFDKVQEQSKDNPVFYVQYAHARIRSAQRKGADIGVDLGQLSEALANGEANAIFADAGELTLIRRLAEWPRVVEAAAKSNEPHRIAFYLYDLASDFHALWNRGNDRPELRLVQENNVIASAQKQALAEACRQVLENGLTICGVKPVEEMR